ncbi:unnamed protein product [Leuciscus chuanchicus]
MARFNLFEWLCFMSRNQGARLFVPLQSISPRSSKSDQPCVSDGGPAITVVWHASGSTGRSFPTHPSETQTSCAVIGRRAARVCVGGLGLDGLKQEMKKRLCNERSRSVGVLGYSSVIRTSDATLSESSAVGVCDGSSISCFSVQSRQFKITLRIPDRGSATIEGDEGEILKRKAVPGTDCG